MDKLITWIGFFGILILTFAVGYFVKKWLTKLINESSRIQQTNPTNYKFLKHVVLAMIYVIGVSISVYSVPQFRTLASSLLATAGIFAVAVGFASQHALSNIISGLFIVIFKPYKVNDRVTVQTYQGVIEDITLRHTVIRNFENRRVIIPNSVISEQVVVNSDFGDQRICRFMEFGISYDSNIDLAKDIMADEVRKHPMWIDVRTPENIEEGQPDVPVKVISLGDSSVNLRAWAWAADQASGFLLNCDVLESVKKRFDAEGISIPFPHRTVYMKNLN